MAKLPLRILGLLLLTLTIGIASCQALFQVTELPSLPEALQQLED